MMPECGTHGVSETATDGPTYSCRVGTSKWCAPDDSGS